ncbi:hypothetical protein E2C01_044104 [Portunus trituberculatus]|uniref:Uncharacterized protein n=1 Tax=Portunus trituberculatus TaxID=210409 RepID=A0A5B7FR69_PORTR|nr:hypothetical protein [Portunus trituberculatus]
MKLGVSRHICQFFSSLQLLTLYKRGGGGIVDKVRSPFFEISMFTTSFGFLLPSMTILVN